MQSFAADKLGETITHPVFPHAAGKQLERTLPTELRTRLAHSQLQRPHHVVGRLGVQDVPELEE